MTNLERFCLDGNFGIILFSYWLAGLDQLPYPQSGQWSNKPCHPNPTALVGNLLTGKGNVIELVKVRWVGRTWCTETFAIKTPQCLAG